VLGSISGVKFNIDQVQYRSGH